jgi:hypothetical protein
MRRAALTAWTVRFQLDTAKALSIRWNKENDAHCHRPTGIGMAQADLGNNVSSFEATSFTCYHLPAQRLGTIAKSGWHKGFS